MSSAQFLKTPLAFRPWATAFLWGLVTIGGLASAADAKPGNNGNGNGRGNRPTEAVVDTPGIDEDVELSTFDFSSAQQQIMLDAIYGRGEYSHFINPDIRIEIFSNRSSLPPGIQQRLHRGGTLPPGIAKKVYLPANLYGVIGLPPGAEILVIGPNIATIDPTTDRILSLLENILL